MEVSYVTKRRGQCKSNTKPSFLKFTWEQSPSSPFALFTAPVAVHAPTERQIVLLRILPETRQIAAIMRAGDITLLSLETDLPTVCRLSCMLSYYSRNQANVEGTFESGIFAAAWSPDDLFLALITGKVYFSRTVRPRPSALQVKKS